MARRCPDRKSTRLNSSHMSISYAVFCLKKKNPDVVSYDKIQDNTYLVLFGEQGTGKSTALIQHKKSMDESLVAGDASLSIVFFFNDTATTEIYTLSLHDALPIASGGSERGLSEVTTATSASLPAI